MREHLVDGIPRPLADAPVAALVDGAETLAAVWLGELIRARPLERAAELPLDTLVADAPALIGVLARALAADADREQLAVGGEAAQLATRTLAPAEPGAAVDPASVVLGAELLRRVIWAALLDAVARPSVEQIAELADRLGHVCALAAIAALAPSGEHDPPGTVVAHDRRPAADVASTLAQALRGRRGDDELAVLLVDVDDAERLLDADAGGAFATALERIGAALGPVAAGGQLLVERPGRYWVVCQCGAATAARDRALQLAAAVGAAATHCGAPLTASVGFAVWPLDGDTAPALTVAAEESMLTARAAGTGVAQP